MLSPHRASDLRRFITFVIVTVVVLASIVSFPVFAQDSEVEEADVNGQAILVNVPVPLTASGLAAIRRQVEKATGSDIGTIIFQFSGRGWSFEHFSELARDIIRLSEQKNLETIAYVPKEAKGMCMLTVFACGRIIADRFAQLGQVTPPADPDKQKHKKLLADEQTVVNKIAGLAAAAGHDELMAIAMTKRQAVVYEMESEGRRRLLDKAGYEKMSHEQRLTTSVEPLVGADEVLLLDGQKAKELGLLDQFADSEQSLLNLLAVQLADLSVADRVDEKAESVGDSELADKLSKAVVITCQDMIDEGLYESIKRRSEAAMADGATHLIFQMDTFGGRVDSAVAISNYMIHELAEKAHTVIYIPTEALSAGALISVACKDIIMKKATKLGDCAPIIMGGQLEGTEREKAESFLRTNFEASAEANGYPVALCQAMVTMSMEVWQVKNLQTGEFEYFETKDMPTDPYVYELDTKKLVVPADRLLTVTAEKALEYGLTRAVVKDLEGAIVFLETRDGLTFPRPVEVLTTNWSEQLVRWLTSPTVAGILFMVALLGIYAEMNSPGVGLPGAVAVAALVVLFGSKYIIGLANWWEIAVFVIGFSLLVIEIFVIPGFGIAGIAGVLLILFSLVTMAVGNRPGEIPLPVTELDWDLFWDNMTGLLGGFFGFLIGSYFISRHLHRLPVANKLILAMPKLQKAVSPDRPTPISPQVPPVRAGQRGVSLTQLHPAGTSRFGNRRIDVVSRGELIEANVEITVVDIEGNRIVVKQVD